MSQRDRTTPAYAVVRLDVPGRLNPTCVTVKEVVSSQELAEAEVARLTALNPASLYFWQRTHLFPEGESFGSEAE